MDGHVVMRIRETIYDDGDWMLRIPELALTIEHDVRGTSES
jgi:hypothetical protein